MNTKEINVNKTRLKNSLDKALLDTMKWTESKCMRKPEEPDYVAALTVQFTHELYQILSGVFLNKRFSVTGVYCHQKPYVDINLRKCPELADILLVYVDTDCRGGKIYNSLLLQAKISQNQEMKVSSSDLHQLELYKKWPKFKYHRARKLNGETRNILPKTITTGAQYLLINNNPATNGLNGNKKCVPMRCSLPDNILYADKSFSDEIIDFLTFRTGRPFDDFGVELDDWSKMIWDLLRIAKGICSKRKNLGIPSFPRENEFVSYGPRLSTLLRDNFISNQICSDDGDSSFDDERGVSVILIEGSSEEERQYLD